MREAARIGRDHPAGGGKYLKTIGIKLTGSISTKVNDAALSNATLFVYQHIDGGEPVLYLKEYTTQPSSVAVDLLFSDQVDYTYSIKAFGNFGDIEYEPEESNIKYDGVIYSNGSLSDINEDVNAISIEMTRYISKISISSIYLNLPEIYETYSFVLKSAYLANVSDSYINGNVLNSDGYQSILEDSGCYSMVFDSVNKELAHNKINQSDISLYCYGTSVKVVLECEVMGKVNYYTIDIVGLSRNVCIDYSVNIHQEGATTPFGVLPVVSVTAKPTGLSVGSFAEESHDTYFGISNEPVFDDNGYFVPWARIQHKDGTLYTANQWNEQEELGNVMDEEANGVAIRYSKWFSSPIVIAPDFEGRTWATFPSSTEWIDGMPKFNTVSGGGITNVDNPISGMDMTNLVLEAKSAGILTTAPAAEYCSSYVFKDGSSGFLPSVTEIQGLLSNKAEINECIEAIGGRKIGSEGGSGNYMWSSNLSYGNSSTGRLYGIIWGYPSYSSIGSMSAGSTYRANPCTEFLYDPAKEFANN